MDERREIDVLSLRVDPRAFEGGGRQRILLFGDLLLKFELVEARNLSGDCTGLRIVSRSQKLLEAGNLFADHLDARSHDLNLRRGFANISALRCRQFLFEADFFQAELRDQAANSLGRALRIERLLLVTE